DTQPPISVVSAAFSPDNRAMLMSFENGSLLPGGSKIQVVDLQGGKTLGATADFTGRPRDVDLASNGIALAPRPNMAPRLYRCPTIGGEDIVKKDPLPISKPGEFVSLFNGKDLTGWRMPSNRKDVWRVENGILIGSGNAVEGQCFTTRDDYKN